MQSKKNIQTIAIVLTIVGGFFCKTSEANAVCCGLYHKNTHTAQWYPGKSCPPGNWHPFPGVTTPANCTVEKMYGVAPSQPGYHSQPTHHSQPARRQGTGSISILLKCQLRFCNESQLTQRFQQEGYLHRQIYQKRSFYICDACER